MLPRTSRGRWPPTHAPWTPEAAPNIHPPRKERASSLPHDTHTQGCWGMGGGAFPPIQKPLPTLPGLSLGGGGAGGVPVCPAHPLPLPLTLQLLTADHSLSLRKDIQTFHFPFCLVLGPVQREPEVRARAQPQPQMATLHPHPTAPPHAIQAPMGSSHPTGLSLGSPSTQQTTQTQVRDPPWAQRLRWSEPLPLVSQPGAPDPANAPETGKQTWAAACTPVSSTSGSSMAETRRPPTRPCAAERRNRDTAGKRNKVWALTVDAP